MATRVISESRVAWTIDFVFDTCADGRQLKCLTVIDEWTRECLAIDASGIRAARVVDVLARLVSVRGAPHYVRSSLSDRHKIFDAP
jgi:putative transposase